MAQLALGIAGAFIGSFFGPLGTSIGFAAGSAIGGAAFGPKAPDGPRIGDKKLQVSQYGQMIPLMWGRERLAGVVIDQTDLQEHEHSSGGKGGSESSTFTYTCSFDVLICERVSGDAAIAGLSRIWADGRLIYDTTGATDVDNSKVPITLYKGTEDQLPDPTFEAIHGVGNISAYRSYAHAVLTDWDVGEFGNRIPNLEWEVFTSEGTAPTRVSSWYPPMDAGGGPHNAYQVGIASAVGDVVTIGFYEQIDVIGIGASTTQEYTEYTFDTAGNQLSVTGPLPVPQIPDNGAGNAFMFMIPAANAQIGFGLLAQQGQNNTLASAWYVRDSMVAYPVHNVGGSPRSHDSVTPGSRPYLYNEFLYVCGSVGSTSISSHVARYPAPSGVPTSSPDVFYTFTTAGGYQVTAGDDGFIYAMGPSGPSRALFKFDMDLTLIYAWPSSAMPATLPQANDQFAVHGGKLFFAGTANLAYGYDIDGTTGFTLSGTTPIEAQAAPRNVSPVVAIGGCLGLTEDGLISLCGTPGGTFLYVIVGDLCARKLDATQYDVSELVDPVTGFKLVQQATLRTAIEALIPGYNFAAVERDVLVAFPKLGKAPIVTIPEDDLAAAEDGQEQPAPRDYTHGHDDDLPRQITVTYQEEDADYQPGSQYEQRQVGGSTSFVTIELPVVTNAKKAKQVATTNLLQAHVERDKYKGSTSRKYLYLEPTDVVGLIDRAVLLKSKEHTPSGLIKWEGAATVAAIYVPSGELGSSGDGFSPPTARPSQPTDLVLIDGPLVTDLDASAGIYSAMAGRNSPTWLGARLYKSVDGGVTYASILSDTTHETFGTCSDALGDFGGGNVFDEINTLTVVLSAGSGSLESRTRAAVLNGSNMAAVGSGDDYEYIQFRDATLIAAGTYVLSGLLRGRRGTEWLMSSHAAGETFVLLPVDNPAAPLAEISLSLLYKAVTTGTSITSATPLSFTNHGSALRCYAPVNLGGGIDDLGGFVLSWVRRTRIGGTWLDFVDVPLSETSEAYVLNIYTDGTFASIAQTFNLTAPTFTWNVADQTDAFGSQQFIVYWGVAQVGAIGPGIESRQTTP